MALTNASADEHLQIQSCERWRARSIRKDIKNPTHYSCAAFWAEWRVFKILHMVGVPAIRGYESSPVDGAFLDPLQAKCIPSHTSTNAAVWRWAATQSDITSLTFDIKFVSLMSGVQKGSDFSYRVVSKKSTLSPAQVHILVFEEIQEYMAVVPREVWNTYSGSTHGVLPLITGVPPCYYPFMVRNDQLPQAVSSLFKAARKESCYRVPTTGVDLRGFIPQLTSSPPIIPRASDPSRPQASHKVVTALWHKIETENLGQVYLNPVAPLICDFLLELPETTELLRIEHKFSGNQLLSFETGHRSPFTRSRQWHFLICQNASLSNPSWFCIGRHEVDEAWAQKKTIHLDPSMRSASTYYGDEGLRRMLQDIQCKAPQAIQNAEQMMFTDLSKDLRPSTLVNLNKAESMPDGEGNEKDDHIGGIDGDMQEYESDLESDSKTQRRDWRCYKELPWLCDRFNNLCRKQKALVCIPLDVGHPLGNHVVIEHRWTEPELHAFDINGTLPVVPYSEELLEKTCIVLRFQDMTRKRQIDSWHLWIRRFYWSQPATLQHFLIIGGWLDPRVRKEAVLPHPYLLLPSEFTSQLDPCNLRQGDSSIGHQGELYFRKVLEEENVIPNPTWPSKSNKQLCIGSAFMVDNNINPARYLLHEDAIYGVIYDMIYKNGPLHIPSPQSPSQNRQFDGEKYLVKMRMVHQTAWDYGLMRKPAKRSRVTKRRNVSPLPQHMRPSQEEDGRDAHAASTEEV